MNLPQVNAGPEPWKKLPSWWPWIVVAAILLLVGVVRVRLEEVPLERDEGEYAYAGQLILQGIPPYELVFNMKLPGTYYAYAIGMALFGQTVTGVHLTLLMVNSLTCVFLFLLGRNLWGGVTGLAACATYALMSVSPMVLGLAAHATQFVALMAVPATLLLRRALAGGGLRVYFFSGLLYGMAFLMKQPGLMFGLFALGVILWQAVEARALMTRIFFHRCSLFLAGLFTPFLFCCLMVLVAGDFKRFWFWTFEYASAYVGRLTLSQGISAFDSALEGQFRALWGLCLLAVLGVAGLIYSRQKPRELIFVLGLLVFSFAATAAGFYFRQHYFILLLPAFALLLGLGVEALVNWLSKWQLSWLAPVLFVAALGVNVYQQREVFFQWSPAQYAEAIYRGNPLGESAQIAQVIRDHSQPDARVAVVGSEPQIYFYAQRHSATGYIYTYPLMEPQRFASAMQRDMIAEIEAAKPDFIVLVNCNYSWLAQKYSNGTIFRWGEQYTHDFYEAVAGVGRGPRTASAQEGWLNGFTNVPPEAMVLYLRKPEAK